MGDIAAFARHDTVSVESTPRDTAQEMKVADSLPVSRPQEFDTSYSADQIAQLKAELIEQIKTEIKQTFTQDIVSNIINVLSNRFPETRLPDHVIASANLDAPIDDKPVRKASRPTAHERIAVIKSIPLKKDTCEQAVYEITLGATKAHGGTRGRTCTIGGDTAMPLHLWEGTMKNRPLVALEVFDKVSPKYPEILRTVWGNLLDNPVEMAKVCVEKYGADLISVRLDGTHPEKGNRSPHEALEVVKSVLAAVDVPLIIIGHSHYDKINEVMKEVARGCEGENLLLSWVEQDNYRTIAGAALAYGHTIVAQSPIDVNIGKQLNILLTNMNIPLERIVMDPVTSAIGYGIEYTYSVMERIRLTGLGGDKMLASPIIVSPGQECAKIKELRAPESDYPAWGNLDERAALWELSTATSLLYAGASIMILYHPQAAQALKSTIMSLMDGRQG
jgi:acetyl-CoA decarbonylase/synthase complex subunit delta